MQPGLLVHDRVLKSINGFIYDSSLIVFKYIFQDVTKLLKYNDSLFIKLQGYTECLFQVSVSSEVGLKKAMAISSRCTCPSAQMNMSAFNCSFSTNVILVNLMLYLVYKIPFFQVLYKQLWEMLDECSVRCSLNECQAK